MQPPHTKLVRSRTAKAIESGRWYARQQYVKMLALPPGMSNGYPAHSTHVRREQAMLARCLGVKARALSHHVPESVMLC